MSRTYAVIGYTREVAEAVTRYHVAIEHPSVDPFLQRAVENAADVLVSFTYRSLFHAEEGGWYTVPCRLEVVALIENRTEPARSMLTLIEAGMGKFEFDKGAQTVTFELQRGTP